MSQSTTTKLPEEQTAQRRRSVRIAGNGSLDAVRELTRLEADSNEPNTYVAIRNLLGLCVSVLNSAVRSAVDQSRLDLCCAARQRS